MKLGTLRQGPAAALRTRVRSRIERLEHRRLLSAGDPDLTWGQNGIVITDVGTETTPQSDVVIGVAVQANGRIVTAGSSMGPDGFQRFSLTRHFANGDIDTGFGENGRVITEFAAENNAIAHSIAIDNAQRIVVAGTSFAGGGDALTVARYTSDGDLDPSFGSGGSGKSVLATEFASDIDVVITDGNEIILGYTQSQGSEADLAIVRFNTSGFQSGAVITTDIANLERNAGIAIDADGNIVQAGIASFELQPNGQLYTTRFLPGGARDTSGYATSTNGIHLSGAQFDGPGSVMIDADGTLLVAGNANGNHPVSGSPTALLRLARVEADGSGVTAVTPGLSNDSSVPWSMAVQADGQILIAGDNFSFDTFEQNYIVARFDSSLGLTGNFGDEDNVVDGVYTSTMPNSSAAGVVADSEGQILLAGFATGDVDSDVLLARHDSDITPGGGGQIFADANARPENDPYVVMEGATLTLSGAGSLTTGGGGVTLVQNQRRVEPVTGGGSGSVVLDWDLDNDGEFDDFTGANPVFNAAGLDGPLTKFVGLRVSDASDANNFAVDVAQVQVNNVSPTATINPVTGTVFEDNLVTLTATVTDGFASEVFTYEWSATDGTNTLTGNGPSFSFTPPDNAEWTVDLRVHDDDGGQDDATPLIINVQNTAPTAEITGGSTSVNEGTAVAFTSNAGDVPADVLSYSWTVKKDGVPYAAGNDPGFAFTPDDNGIYELNLTVSDEDGGSTDATTVFVTANNIAPVPTVTGDTVGVRGETRTLNLEADDPSSVDLAAGFTFTVDWGDGSPVETFLPGTIAAQHTYEQNGTFGVTVTAQDQDEATSAPFVISMITQTASLENGVLLLSGGTGPDKIRVFRNAGGEVSVGISDAGNGAAEFIQSYPGVVNRVVISTQAGDDQVDASAMNIPVEVYGGAGDDKLIGGTSADILIGGTGDDKLIGGPGRDLLIGGRDADKILGDTDEDVLVGGYSAHDGDVVALRLISDEWRSTRSYTTRVNNIRGTVLTNDRANGNTHLTADVTTWDDDAVDLLSGDAGRDWFFFNADTSTSMDKVVDADTLLEIMDEVDMEP